MKNPVISLLTDFGTADHYVGAIKGVILDICQQARLVDISHEISPYAIAEAAYTLAQAWMCFPAGTTHLVVVDPGVGSLRRPILAEAEGHYFVAPDNGVLTMALASAARPRVREITAARYFRKPVSQTFHGRDIFGPVAAHLALGTSAGKFGKRIADYVRLDDAQPRQVSARAWKGEVLKIDRFGNVVTNWDGEMWRRVVKGSFAVTAGRGIVSRFSQCYADAGDGPFVIPGSAGYIEISVNKGSAAEVLGVRAGSSLELRLL